MNVHIPGFTDLVRFSQYYDGRPWHGAEIFYGGNNLFAIDGLRTMHLALNTVSRYHEVTDPGLRGNLVWTPAPDTMPRAEDMGLLLDLLLRMSDEAGKAGDKFGGMDMTARFETRYQGASDLDAVSHIVFEEPFTDIFCPYLLYNGERFYNGLDTHSFWVHDDSRMLDRIERVSAACNFVSSFQEVKDSDIWYKLRLKFSDILKTEDMLAEKLRLKMTDAVEPPQERLKSIIEIKPLSDSITDTPCYLYYGGVSQYAGDCLHDAGDGNIACDGLFIEIKKRKRRKRRIAIFL